MGKKKKKWGGGDVPSTLQNSINSLNKVVTM